MSRNGERFRDFIESRAAPTGAWGGRVEGGRVDDDDADDAHDCPSRPAERQPMEIGRFG